MNEQTCRFDDAVLEAVRSGQWEESLRTHAAVCPVCQDLVLVSRLLQRDAGDAAAEQSLPSPEQIWWKMELRARQATRKKATRPIAFVENGAFVAVFLAGAVGLSWTWPYLQRWLTQMQPNWLQTLSSLGLFSSPSLLIWIGGGLALLTLSLSVFFAWATE